MWKRGAFPSGCGARCALRLSRSLKVFAEPPTSKEALTAQELMTTYLGSALRALAPPPHDPDGKGANQKLPLPSERSVARQRRGWGPVVPGSRFSEGGWGVRFNTFQ